MKNVITILVALVALAISYNIYLSLSQTSLTSTINSDPKSAHGEKNISVPDELTKPNNSIVEQQESQKNSTPSNDNTTNNKTEEQLENNSLYTESEEVVFEEYVSPDKMELNNWTAGHKERLMKILDKELPSGINKHYKRILTDNYLNVPSIQQDLYIDDEWATMMESELIDFTINHELADKYDIYDITCKQLRCGIASGGVKLAIWVRFQNELRVYLESKYFIFPESGVPLTAVVSHNELSYIYTHITFENSNAKAI